MSSSSAGPENDAFPRCQGIASDGYALPRRDRSGLVYLAGPIGLRAFDHEKPLTRMLPGSTPCELRLMLPDSTMGSGRFHDVVIENLADTPAWRSSHVSPSDMTALRRRWPRAIFRTTNRHGPEMERLRRCARHWPDWAFRPNALGVCPVCEDWIESVLDVYMTNVHLEMAQLWRCPVEWCVVWKGSVRACQEHLSEKHGGSFLFDLKNMAKFFPHGLFPATSGKWLFGLMFRVLLWTLASSMRPVLAPQDGVIPCLLSCVCRAMAIARLTQLRISIPASGAPPGHVPADCFPGGAPRRNRPGSLRVSFADDVSMLAVGLPTVCSPVLEEPAPLVSPIVVEDVVIPEGEMYGPSDVVPDAIPPPPFFLPFSWPIASECVTVERFGSSLGDGALPEVLVSNPDVEPPSSPIAQDQVSASADSPHDVLLIYLVDVGTDSVPDVIRPVAPSPPIEQLFAPDRLWAPVAIPSPAIDDRRETPVPRWQLAREGPFLAERSPESIRSLGAGCAFRNTSYHCSDYDTPLGEFGLPCIIRGSLSRSGFRSLAAFWTWGPVGGWIICHVMGPLLPPYNCNEMLVSCKPTLTFWTNIRWCCRGRRRN